MHTPGPLTFNRREIGDKSILMEIPGDGWHRLSCEVCCDDCDVETAVHNAKLLAASYTSYDRHCGPRAIELAECDLLGELIAALKQSHKAMDDLLDVLYGQGLDVAGWHMNGDMQSMDSFFDDNEVHESHENAAAVLSKLHQPNGESHVEG